MAKEARPRNQRLLIEAEVDERRHTLIESIWQFNDGYFFESHETLEDLWYASPPPFRNFLQGIIQAAAAFVHLKRHEFPGTIGLLDAALEKLAGYPAEFMGVDVTRLVAETRRARDDLAELGPTRFEEWDHGRIPTIRLVGESPTEGVRD